jgi:hypothetical protein
MKQYKITSANFYNEGDTGNPDAFMDPRDLAELKQLAGIGSLLETTTNIQQDHEEPFSPVGAVNNSMSQKRQIEKNLNIKTGTDEWFRLYFARPELTGEKPVGDDLPDTEPNPSYLLDKDGLPDAGKVETLADKLEKRWQNEKNQAANSKPKY